MPRDTVLEGDRGTFTFGPHPQRGRASGGLPAGAFGLRQFPAGAGVAVGGGDAVRGRDGGPDLLTCTVAGVKEASGIQPLDGFLVQPQPLRLAYDGPVPVEPDGAEVRELVLLDPGPHPRAVEVLHPHQEASPGGSGEEPGKEGRPKVPNMERPRRARGEASSAVERRRACIRLSFVSGHRLESNGVPVTRGPLSFTLPRYALELR